MPLQKLQFRPGVNREGTTLANEGGWYDCDKVRFRSGYPEKVGGWSVETYTTFMGICRSLWNWITLKGYNLAGIGTNLKFYIESGGAYYDITPIRTNTTNNTTFAADTSAPFSAFITVTDAGASSLQAGDFVTFSQAVALSTQTYTADASTDVITFTNALANGTTITLFTTNTTPGGLSVGITYYVVNASGATCKLSLTPGGSAIDITTAGTGTQTFALTTGITAGILNQEYQIQTVLSGTSYTIVARAAGAPIDGYNFTVNTTTSVISISLPSTVTIANGNTVSLIISAGAPGALNYAVTYYLVNVSGSTAQLSLTSGGTPITLTSQGIGLQSLYLTVESNASDSGNGGGATDAAYQINAGYPIYTIGTGWGTGPWSRSTWGSGTSTGFGLQLRLWSQSNFGEDLLFNPRGGSLYLWQPGAGATPAYGTRGTIVSGTYTPSIINEIMVSDSSRIVIAFGCNDPSGTYGPTVLDPMLIRWTDQESYTQWEPLTTNQAGDYRLSHGSEIVAALQTRQEINVWTDAAIYSMQYLGPPFVWGFTLLADNISIASPNAMATASGVVYWMGVDKFYVYSGRVETLPCSVRTYIYDDINRDQFAQIYAGTNEGYSEVWWFYCSANSNIVDRYVIFNYLDRVWYYGTMDRTAWLDSALRQFPMATTGTNNLLVYHESAIDDGTTNPPSAINTYIQSSDFDIGDGHNYGFVWRIIPDITFNGSNTLGTTTINPEVNFTVRPRQNPGSGYGVPSNPLVKSSQTYAGQQTYSVQEFTEIVYTRVRGRQIAFKVESNTRGTQWQLGVPRIDVREDGRR